MKGITGYSIKELGHRCVAIPECLGEQQMTEDSGDKATLKMSKDPHRKERGGASGTQL